MCEFNYEFIENQIGKYHFQNKKLLRQAFIRRSYSEEHGGENNEVLEFYGDKVLEFIVGKLFAEWFEYGQSNYKIRETLLDVAYRTWDKMLKPANNEYRSKYDEGKLTEFRKMLVSRQTLAQRIDELGLIRYLLIGKSDEENDVRNNDAVKEDLFEAILGAVAIDSRWNINNLESVVNIMLYPGQFFFEDNFVGEITEWTIDNYGCVPEIRYDIRPDADKLESRIIKDKTRSLLPGVSQSYCLMRLGNYEHWFLSDGGTRAEARDNVYRFAYEHLLEKELLNPLKNEIDEPSEDMAINDLETLARRGYFELPKYKFTETHDKNGNPVWNVTCLIDGFDNTEARDSSKKKAKKKAAYKMLIYVIENYYDEED